MRARDVRQLRNQEVSMAMPGQPTYVCPSLERERAWRWVRFH